MYKEFIKIIKNTMVYGIGDIAPKVVGFFMVPVYTRLLTPADYGIMSMLMLLNTFLGIVLPVGMNQAFMRFYFEAENEREKGAVYTTAVLFLAISGSIIAMVLSMFSGQISLVLFSATKYSTYVKIMLIILVCDLIKIVPRQFVVAKERAVFYTCHSMGSFILAISLNIYFIVILKKGVLGFIYSSLITEIVIAAFLVIVTLPKKGLEFSFKWLKEMLKFGFPLVFSSLTMFIYMFSDRFLMEKFYSLAAVGLYSLSLQFGDIISYVTGPFQTASIPFTLSNYKEKHGKEMFSRLFTYSFLVFCFMGLILSVYINNVFSIMVGKEFSEAYKLVPIIVLSVLFKASYFSFSLGITITKRTGYFVYIYTVAAIVNVLLLVCLIPKFGALGGAISRMITFLILLLLGYTISQRLFYIKYEFRRIAQMATIALCLYFISLIIPAKPFFISIGMKSVLVALYPICLFLSGFLHKEEIEKFKSTIRMQAAGRKDFLKREGLI